MMYVACFMLNCRQEANIRLIAIVHSYLIQNILE